MKKMQQMPPASTKTLRYGFAMLAIAGLLLACDSKQGKPEAIPLPENLAQPVATDGIRFQALAYLNHQQSEIEFGFDILNTGLLPVQLSVDNRSGTVVKIIPRQTFLIDSEGQAWPLLAIEQLIERLQREGIHQYNPPSMPALDKLDSLTGFALDVTVSSNFQLATNTQARPRAGLVNSMKERNFHNPKIPAGEVASGVLFFPAREEAKSANRLRLCFQQDGRVKFLNLPLKASPP